MSEENKEVEQATTEPAAPEAVKESGPEQVAGKVKWFSNVKGFGFLTSEGNERDVFVHYSSIQGDGYKTLNEAEEVTFQIMDSDKGPQAANVIRTKKPKEEKK